MTVICVDGATVHGRNIGSQLELTKLKMAGNSKMTFFEFQVTVAPSKQLTVKSKKEKAYL